VSAATPVAGAQIFERTARHDAPPTSRSEGERVARTLELIPSSARSVLDVGCGSGALTHLVERPLVVGCDAALRGLRRLRLPASAAALPRLPFASDSVDVVLCSETLEHLDPQLLAASAAELLRIARRSVVVTVPAEEQLLESSHRCPRCGLLFHLHGHQRSFAPRDLLALFPTGRRRILRRCFRVRPFSPWLLRLRAHGLGLYKYSAHTLCPGCGNQALPNHERRLAYRLVSGLNQALHPRRSTFNWLLLRVDL